MASKNLNFSDIRKIEEEEKKKTSKRETVPTVTNTTQKHQSAVYKGNADRDNAKQKAFDKAKARKQTYEGLSDNGKAMMDSYKSLSNADKKTISKYRQTGKGDGSKSINGVSLDNWRDMTKAMDYQQSAKEHQNKTSYNEDYDKAISFDKKDKNALMHLYSQGGLNTALTYVRQNNLADKYGMSEDRLLNFFQKQMDNEEVKMAEKHPFAAEVGTAITSIPRAILGLNSTVANSIAPNSDYADWAEEARELNSDTAERFRTGVKENYGDKGDNVIDTINAIADRAIPTILGNTIGGPVLGGVMGGAADTNTQMDILNQRPDMSAREKALSALGHGTVEGIGTGITAGILDLPFLQNVGSGAKDVAQSTAKSVAKNIGKNAFNAAFENSISEIIENSADTLIGGDNSQKEYDRLVALLNGATEEEAEAYAKENQAKKVGMAAITGAGFGGATTAIKGLPSLIRSGIDGVPKVDVFPNGGKGVLPSENVVEDVVSKQNIDGIDAPVVAPKVYVPSGNVENAYDGEISVDNINDMLAQAKQYGDINSSRNARLAEEANAQPKTIAELMAEAQANGVEPTTNTNTLSIEAPQTTTELPTIKRNKSTGTYTSSDGKYIISKGGNGWDVVDTNNGGDPSHVTTVRTLTEAKDFVNKSYGLPETEPSATVPMATNSEPEIAPNTTTPQGDSDISSANNRVPFVDNQNATSDTSNVKDDIVADVTNNGKVSDGTLDDDIEGTSKSKRLETLKKWDVIARSEDNLKMVDEAESKKIFNKGVENRVKAQEKAMEIYAEDSEKAIQNNLADEWDSGKDADISMLALHDALDNGDNDLANQIMLKQVQEGKKSGRILRAFRDYVGTKEGALSSAIQYMGKKADEVLKNKKSSAALDKMVDKILKGNLDDLGIDEGNLKTLRNALDNGASKEDIKLMLAMYQTCGKMGVSAEARAKVDDIYNQIAERNLGVNSKERAELELDVYKVLANDIGGKRTWSEMWDSWRYFAMLGNPKTHLRNIIGNTTHYMVTEIKDNVGAVIEEAIDRANRMAGGEGIDRTKTILTSADDNLVEAGRLDADNIYTRLNDGHKYTDVQNEIARARSAFNGNKPLNALEEFNSKMLDSEDYSALKRKYSKALARFLKANGTDESIFDATDDASKALLEKARSYAIDQAKQATFHEYSAAAQALTNFSSNMRSAGGVNKLLGNAVEGVLPFKKTPINILKQAMKYSPISLAKAIKTGMDAVKTGNKSASDVIEDLAAGLTGTGIMALGGFLASQGYLSGKADENYDVDNAETAQGKQNYALQIGNKSYTLDWAAPASLPLFVGVELFNAAEKGGLEFDEVLSALSGIAEPVTELSMLQGISDVLDQLSYSPMSALVTFATNTALGYVTQGIPTLAGQIARSVDDTRRSTYTEKANGLPKQLDRTLVKTMNKLPVVSTFSQPYVDSKGNIEKNQGLASYFLGDNIGTRMIDQMLSPGYFKEGTVTDTDKELNRLYEATGTSVYPTVSNGKVGDSKLSKEKFTQYQTLYGQNTSNFSDAIIQSEGYASLDDTQKASTLQDARNFAKNIADYEIGGKTMNTDYNKAYEAYKQNGIDGVTQYYDTKIKAKSLDMTYDQYPKKEAEYEGGAEQYAQDRQDALKYGFVQSDGDPNVDAYKKALDLAGGDVKLLEEVNSMGLGTKATNTYMSARSQIPSLTTNMYSNLYGEVNTDGNDGITQKEFKEYLNKYNSSEEEAMLLYQIFGGEWSKSPYVTKNGTWSLK